MRVAVKGLVLALGLVAVPTAASVMVGMRFSGAHPLLSASVLGGPRLGGPEDFGGERDLNTARTNLGSAPVFRIGRPRPIELAQLDEVPIPPAPGTFGRMPHPPIGFGPMGLPGLPPRLALSPRQACEEDIDRHAALAGYLKSKLRLQDAQKEAWLKIEIAAAPAIEALHGICGELPDGRTARPSMPDAIEHAQRRLSATAEFLRAIREPLRALYETLSADQRAALDPPPPPPM